MKFLKAAVAILAILAIFEHVQPRQGFSWQMLPELFKLYLFIWQVMFFVT